VSLQPPSDLLEWINARHGTTYRLLHRYPGGESGAYAVRDAGGGRFALKWDPDLASVKRFRAQAEVARWLGVANRMLADVQAWL
jgi:hypothetical protein